MKIFRRVSAVVLAGILSLFSILAVGTPVFADGKSCGGAQTTLIECGESGGVDFLLLLVVRILVGLIGTLGVIGIVISGIQYLTAGGNEAQVTKAKNRLMNVVIGLIAYGLITVFLNWLIPGGIF